ncbi:MAG TPA: 4Fe-4S binding protein, partial [Lamprocystis sp. (in: g-proteobacteria)]|nr:4Fe-4S binding protein [Lamprocystis sp. (in: g-proteobacteria)]
MLLFPELCHGCGSCTLVCPELAISERLLVLGEIDSGLTPEGIDFAQGVMNVGQPMAVPILRELKRWSSSVPPVVRAGQDRDIEICDAPPGASCPVVETMRGADF